MSDSLQPHKLYTLPGFSVHGILQARILEPGFSVHGISRQEYWSGLPFPPPEDLPDPGTEPWSPESQADSLPLELQGSPILATEPFENLKSYHAILLSLNFLVASY